MCARTCPEHDEWFIPTLFKMIAINSVCGFLRNRWRMDGELLKMTAS